MAPLEAAPRLRRVGLLALQGAFEEHEASFGMLPEALRQQFELLQVRTVQQLDLCDALVIPGGESTTMKIIAGTDLFMQQLKAFVHGGAGADGVMRAARPCWGTCAGCILLSDDVANTMTGEGLAPAKRCKYGDSVGGLDISTCRNFFGRQAASFEAPVTFPEAAAAGGDEASELRRRTFQDYPAVFIRAPAVLKIGEGARALAKVQHPVQKLAGGAAEDGVVVAAENDRILVTCFHPELSKDCRIHQYFVERFVLPAPLVGRKA